MKRQELIMMRNDLEEVPNPTLYNNDDLVKMGYAMYAKDLKWNLDRCFELLVMFLEELDFRITPRRKDEQVH